MSESNTLSDIGSQSCSYSATSMRVMILNVLSEVIVQLISPGLCLLIWIKRLNITGLLKKSWNNNIYESESLGCMLAMPVYLVILQVAKQNWSCLNSPRGLRY